MGKQTETTEKKAPKLPENYKKTPTVYQMEFTECGAASLAMILAYFGKYLPLERMRVEVGVSRDGVLAGNIMRCGKRMGLEVHGYRREPEKLLELDMPCIIHWNFNHFVVLEGFKGGWVYLNDPAVGRRRISWEELDECFTGVVMTFKRTDAFVEEKSSDKLLPFVLSKVRNEYGVLFKLFYIGLLLVFPGLVLPALSQVFMDDVLLEGYTDWTNRILILMGACVLLRMGLSWYRSVLLEKLSTKLTVLSGRDFLQHMLRLPMSFFDQRGVGDLVTRMDNNTQLNTFLAGELAETVLNIIVALFYLVVLLLYSPLLTAVGLVNVAVCLGVVFFSRRVLEDRKLKIQTGVSKLYSSIVSGIGISDTIKAAGAEREYVSRILGYQAAYAGEEQALSRFQTIVGIIPKAMGDITDVLLLLVGGILVTKGRMTMGMLIAFNGLFDSFCEPVNQLVGFIEKTQTLKANIRRVEDIEKYPEESFGPEKSKEEKNSVPARLRGEVELRGVAFGYSALKPPLVKDFSFTVHLGESVAFVGPSGCGKSTVARLTGGLYTPWEGQVLLDGKDMKELDSELVHRSVASVSQNISLFSGSVRDNISMWNRDMPMEDIERAAKDACIHDTIIALPDGYNFLMAEGGYNFSGGQRQRLEIARALAGNPSILIMDEATSALDAVTENKVLENIRRRGCTCIVVAHRLSAFRDCEQILVMKDGEIIQRGDHGSLMGQQGYYRLLLQNS